MTAIYGLGVSAPILGTEAHEFWLGDYNEHRWRNQAIQPLRTDFIAGILQSVGMVRFRGWLPYSRPTSSQELELAQEIAKFNAECSWDALFIVPERP